MRWIIRPVQLVVGIILMCEAFDGGHVHDWFAFVSGSLFVLGYALSVDDR